MVSDELWFKDTGVLLEELRNVQAGDARPDISGYDIGPEIARGGQGVVFEAVQQSTRRRVAIKVLLEGVFASGAGKVRFEREIDLAAGLRHANIVQVYDRGETSDGRLYFVMEYIDGLPLDEFLSGRRDDSGDHFNATDTLGLFACIGDAINHAHQRGVIHRDLKPSNIRVDAEGQPHVLDFGLAKVYGEAAPPKGDSTVAPEVSITGQFLGSLPWASPEQAEGTHELMDIRSDVYSLGVMLYQVFTERFPYKVTGPLREVLDNIVSAEPQRPSTFGGSIDDELETIVLKCLAKEPARRYQSAGDLARDLRHYLAGEPIEAKRDSTWYTLSKTLKRHKFAMGSAAGFLMFLTGFSITMALLWTRAADAETLATQRLVDVEAESRRALDAEQLAQTRLTELEIEAEKVEYVNEFMLTAMVFQNNDREDFGDMTVRELLDNAVAQIDTTQWLDGRPAVVAEVHNNFSYWMFGSRRFEEAALHQLEALRLRGEVYGENDLRLNENLRSLCFVYTELDQPETALQYGNRSVALIELQDEIDHSLLAHSLITLGMLQVEYDQLEDALAMVERVRDISTTHLEPDAWQPIIVKRLHGMTLTKLQRYEEAEAELLSSHQLTLAKWGPGNQQTALDAEALVELYEAWDKPEKARQYQTTDESGDDG